MANRTVIPLARNMLTISAIAYCALATAIPYPTTYPASASVSPNSISRSCPCAPHQPKSGILGVCISHTAHPVPRKYTLLDLLSCNGRLSYSVFSPRTHVHGELVSRMVVRENVNYPSNPNIPKYSLIVSVSILVTATPHGFCVWLLDRITSFPDTPLC